LTNETRRIVRGFAPRGDLVCMVRPLKRRWFQD
jgi:hypothetical protein